MQAEKQIPQPRRERWQPLRSGFLNLYRFDREEFYYENGRLLLRGNNGTGKSRVLALQLPFLLDGEVVSQRLEPDADPAKRVEWNLLMGRYPDRTGYTWIEFGRRNGAGEHYITLGCGLSAAEDQTGVRRWFFMTTQRIGVDLELANEANQVFGKDRLREKIGGAGQVFEDLGAYRRAVNDALFHLDEYRYGSLMNLLIQLRRPQLTRRLDENELSAALSEALPPVSSTVIANLAEAFRSLESDRNKWESLRAALTAVERFLTSYRIYAEVAAKRQADRVLSAHYEYEAGMKQILIAESDCDRSLAELARLKIELQRLSDEQHALQAEIDALEHSEEMKGLQDIDRASREAKERRMEAESAAAELNDATQARKAVSDEHIRIKGVLEQCEARLTAAEAAAGLSAASAGLENAHREFIESLDVLHSVDQLESNKTQESIGAAIQAQLGKIEHIRKLNQRIASARNELQQDAVRRDQLSGLLDDARERLNVARQEHSSAIASFFEIVDEWRASVTELPLPSDDTFWNAVAEWCESPQLPSPLHAAIRNALEEVTLNCGQQRACFLERIKTLPGEVSRLKEEREQFGSDEQPASAIPRLRSGPDRRGRPGAPLWLLCDFVDDLDMASRAGIEAALEASGLLDAWVTPSGELLDPENLDVVLVAADSPLPADDAHLGTILAPSIASLEAERQTPPYVVGDILRHIGAKPDAGHTWVSVDGQWRNGLLRGRSNKPVAEYIGQTAREMTRWRRVLDLDAAVAETQTRLDSLQISIDELDRRERVARSEADAAPADSRLRAAYDQVMAAAREADGMRGRLAETDEHIAQQRIRLDEAEENRDRAGGDLGIGKWADDLDTLEKEISSYRLTLSVFFTAAQSFLDTKTASQKAWTYVEEASARERRHKEIAERLERAAFAAEIAHDAFRQAASGAEQTLKRLDEARRRLEQARIDEKEARRRQHDTELAVTRMEERLRNRTEMLNGQTDRRDTAASSLRAFACTGLLKLAAAEIEDQGASVWTTARTVEAAFDLTSRLDSIESSDSVWEQHQKSAPSQFNELMRSLSAQGCQPSATFCDDVFVATAFFQGRECTMDQLCQALFDEVSALQMLLDAREKEILENHLAGDVSGHLHELLSAAEQHVRQMNVELENCPMSTGMRLRFVWRPAEEGPLGLAEVKRRLARSTGAWSPADCRLLGSFLHQQIQAVCFNAEGGTWQESLAEALDYRKWHRFDVERHQDGVWKRLTRRTHGTGSGGEKAVALTLPHFAAAAAFYRTADPLAPRLILLDEAFVGIDGDMRAKCMGLINTFDLDFIMTSEREWGCYQTLPGLAIYHLSTRPGIDAIGLTRWVWNGQQRILKRNLTSEEAVPTIVATDEAASGTKDYISDLRRDEFPTVEAVQTSKITTAHETS